MGGEEVKEESSSLLCACLLCRVADTARPHGRVCARAVRVRVLCAVLCCVVRARLVLGSAVCELCGLYTVRRPMCCTACWCVRAKGVYCVRGRCVPVCGFVFVIFFVEMASRKLYYCVYMYE